MKMTRSRVALQIAGGILKYITELFCNFLANAEIDLTVFTKFQVLTFCIISSLHVYVHSS